MGLIKDGYILFRDILTAKEVDQLISKIDFYFEARELENSQGFITDGVVKNNSLWKLLYHPRILEKIKSILGDDIKFLQHNTLFKNFSGSYWHRDSVDQIYCLNGDWDYSEPYKIVRVALYLEDTRKNGFRLGFIKGSHLRQVKVLEHRNLLTKTLEAIEKRLIHFTLTKYYFPFLGFCIYPNIRKGDMYVFDPRLYHRGVKINDGKHAIIFTYGIKNSHSDRYSQYYQDMPEYSVIPDKLKTELKKRNLFFKKTKSN